ncbi:MAG TPA: cytochrome c-type biogenesis protein [Rhodocyclaceae bacterium]|nr:cytochrome c-type biogenesis protein [Rhodocyclaceae bacterium]
MILVKRLFVVLVALFGFLVFMMSHKTASAAEAMPIAAEPVVEARLQALSQELRCLVCQNETLAASRAELAEDLRREIRSMIREGMTDAEIVDFLVIRYGDFVRYRPPFKANTWLLWLAPFLMLLAGGGLLYRLVKRSGDVPSEGEPA